MAAKKWFLVSTKAPGLQFEIVELDRTNMRATLKGDTGVPFVRDINQEALDKYGYKIVMHAAETTPEASDAPVDN